MKNKYKSPLTSEPLRYPAQSLDEEIEELISSEGMTFIILPIFSIVVMALEWWKWYSDAPHSPINYSLFAFIVTVLSIYKIFKLKKKIKKLKLGRNGERVIGQFLEHQRENGCKVFHDIIGENFNIDHVLICQKGIFSIETKTYSKPAKGKAIITLNGEKLLINGKESKSEVIIQAKAEANWLKKRFSTLTGGRKVEIKPVVLFPGWFIDTKLARSNVWVLNPRSLAKYLENMPQVYEKNDVASLANYLSQGIREHQLALNNKT